MKESSRAISTSSENEKKRKTAMFLRSAPIAATTQTPMRNSIEDSRIQFV